MSLPLKSNVCCLINASYGLLGIYYLSKTVLALFFSPCEKKKHNLRINQFHYLDTKLHLIADYNQIHIIELSSLETPAPPSPLRPLQWSSWRQYIRQLLSPQTCPTPIVELSTFLTASLRVMLQLLTTCCSLSAAKRTTQRYL